MKKFAIVALLVMVSSSVLAGTIMDLQMGGTYIEGDEVIVSGAVVIAARYNGIFISEDPNVPYAGGGCTPTSTPASSPATWWTSRASTTSTTTTPRST